MRTWISILIGSLLFTTPCMATEYWVYVRLEDRSGKTAQDDVGRSKRGDVVAVLPITAQHTPSETEKSEYMIFQVTLNKAQKDSMLEDWSTIDYENKRRDLTAYRRNKIDLTSLNPELGQKQSPVDQGDISMIEKTEQDLVRYEVKRYIYLASLPFRRLADIIIPKAFAETVSTINKTGETYNTLTLWEDAKDGNLVGETRQETAECYDDDGILDDKVSINGSTTNATYYMKITVPAAERHDGTAGSGFVLTSSGIGASYSAVITFLDYYTVIEWLEIANWTGNAWSYKLSAIAGSYNSDNSTVSNNIIHDPTVGNIQTYYGIKVGLACKVFNNIVYSLKGKDDNDGNWESVGISVSGSSLVYNNTLYNITQVGGSGTSTGILCSSSTCKNNIVIGSDIDFEFASATNDYNASSDNTAIGANSMNSGDASPPTIGDFISVTGGSENLHLKQSAVELNKGVDLGTTANIDIDNRDRNAQGDIWEIGADEVVEAAEPDTPSQSIINIMI